MAETKQTNRQVFLPHHKITLWAGTLVKVIENENSEYLRTGLIEEIQYDCPAECRTGRSSNCHNRVMLKFKNDGIRCCLYDKKIIEILHYPAIINKVGEI